MCITVWQCKDVYVKAYRFFPLSSLLLKSKLAPLIYIFQEKVLSALIINSCLAQDLPQKIIKFVEKTLCNLGQELEDSEIIRNSNKVLKSNGSDIQTFKRSLRKKTKNLEKSKNSKLPKKNPKIWKYLKNISKI